MMMFLLFLALLSTVSATTTFALQVVPKPPTARTYSVHASTPTDPMQGLYVQECWADKGVPVGFFLPAKYATDPNWGPAYSRFLAEATLGDPPGCGSPKRKAP